MLDELKNVAEGKITFSAIYPVGSIYMSVNNTSPASLFGGTWQSWGSGRVPISVNTSDSEFSTVEKQVEVSICRVIPILLPEQRSR